MRKAAAGMLGGWVDQAEGDLIQVGRAPSHKVVLIPSSSLVSTS